MGELIPRETFKKLIPFSLVIATLFPKAEQYPYQQENSLCHNNLHLGYAFSFNLTFRR